MRLRGATVEDEERSGGDDARSYRSHEGWRAERTEFEEGGRRGGRGGGGGGGGGGEYGGYYPHYAPYPSSRRFSPSLGPVASSEWRRAAPVDSPEAADRIIRPHSRHGTRGTRPLHPEQHEATQSPSPVAAAAGGDQEPEPSTRTRNRHGRPCVTLTEADREDIMARIRKGEKQADLAKEYRVSRAAITNLKQRRQMLEMLARSGEEEHKWRRPSEGDAEEGGGGGGGAEQDSRMEVEETAEQSDGGESTTSSGEITRPQSTEAIWMVSLAPTTVTTAATTRSPLLRELATTTTSRLLATLTDPQSSDDTFRSADSRLVRLLLEEAIGHSFSIATGHNGVHTVDTDSYKPVGVAFGHYEAARLLREYAQLEPEWPVAATATMWPLVTSRTNETERTIDLTVRIPSTVQSRSPVLVFLDNVLDVDENPATACPDPTSERPHLQQLLFTIHALMFSGVSEHLIVVVVDLCPHSVAQAMAQRFPAIQLLTTRLVGQPTDPGELGPFKAVRQRRRQLLQRQ